MQEKHKIKMFDISATLDNNTNTCLINLVDEYDVMYKTEKKPVVVKKGFRARKGEYTEDPEKFREFRNIKRF